MVKKLLDLYKLPTGYKQINLQAQITDNLYLIGDEAQLTRVFTNLIENALNW